MIINKLEHLEIIYLALTNLPVQGTLGDPDFVSKIIAAQEVLALINVAIETTEKKDIL